jgi:REP element-mobilizing transposase RayT
MARKPVILQSEFPFFVTVRSNNRERFSSDISPVWEVFVEEMNETVLRYGFVNHEFLLMSNHFHWLASTPLANISEGMRYFLTETSRKIARLNNRINKVYGSRYKATMIVDPRHYMNCYRYLLQNPVRAQICERVEQYPWSTFKCDRMINASPPAFHLYIPKDPIKLIEWLNILPDPEVVRLIKCALRKTEFKFGRDRRNHRIPTGTEFL